MSKFAAKLFKVHADLQQHWCLLKTAFEATGNQSLSVVKQVNQGTPLLFQDFAVCEVPSGSSLKDPTSPTQEFFQASLIGDSTLEVCHEFKPQVPARRSKECQVQEGHATRYATHPVCYPN
jgi:hypothetical protein